MTTDPTVPDAAVQIADGVLDAIGYTDTGIEARAVCEALAANGWLHDPARVAAVEAENERLRKCLRPRDAGHAEDWLYERAEDAAAVGLPEERALEMVRYGYSSIAADRAIAEDPRQVRPE